MLAQRPPMGWNSWNTFGENISEELIMGIADAMVEKGLRDAGYEYIVIDDCWSLRERGEDGRLVADPKKFPHGMKYLADYIHSKGMKFGMYSCAGTLTCAGYPSSFDHEYLDAQTFADFGIDFLKYDFCYKPETSDGPLLYYRMGMALKATGREILFSACNWGSDNVWQWIRSTGAHMYRSTGDIVDRPNSFRDIAFSQIPMLSQSAPGCYNDTDMLICGMYNKGNVGFGGCNQEQYDMHFALWCMMASPLMIGCDIRNCDEHTLELLKNKALIALDQDEEARPPYTPNRKIEEVLLLFRHLSVGEYALGVFNFAEGSARKYINLFELGLTANCGYGLELTGMLDNEKITVKDNFYLDLPATSCKVYRVKLIKL